MKKVALVFSLLLLISPEIKGQDCNGTNKREIRVLKLINSLPEILIENQFRKSAHSATFLKAYIQRIPTNTDHNYYVSINEEKGERLFTYDWYKVNSRTYVISYCDMINNKTMSLKEWRMHNKQLSKHKTLS